jgi:hypothetical protein
MDDDALEKEEAKEMARLEKSKAARSGDRGEEGRLWTNPEGRAQNLQRRRWRERTSPDGRTLIAEFVVAPPTLPLSLRLLRTLRRAQHSVKDTLKTP